MKKNLNRWLALLLAVIMVSGSCLINADGFLQATGTDTPEITQEGEAEETPSEDIIYPENDQPVEEKQEIVIPPQENAPEAGDAGSEAPGETPSDKTEKLYQVTFTKPELDGGVLSVWTRSEEKSEVTYKEETPKASENAKVTETHIEMEAGETITLHGAEGTGHEWIISNYGKLDSIGAENKQDFTVEAKEAARKEVFVYHKYKENPEDTKKKTETFEISILDDYALYFYTLIPGMQEDSSPDLNKVWNGMGVGSIRGVGVPNDYQDKTIIYGGTITEPDSYPEITVGDVIYTYAAPGSGNEEVKGYYTIDWFRTRVAKGANTGGNAENPGVDPNEQTFHRDGQLILNETGAYTVTFKIQEPKEDTFTTQEDYSCRVKEGFQEAELKKPDTSAKTVDGRKWVFDGWYLDPELTQKADFDGTITDHRTYYGKYVLNEDGLRYDGNGAEGTMNETIGKPNSCVAVAENGFTRDGYTFAGWNTKANGSGKTYKAGEAYQLTDEDDVLYAQWSAGKAYIRFEENGGTEVGDLEGKTGDQITDTNMPETTRKGYKFTGWYAKKSLTGGKVTALPESYPAGTTTYYAKWQRDTSVFKVENYKGKYDGEAHTVLFDETVLAEGESLRYWNSKSKRWQNKPITYTDVTDGEMTVEVGVLDKNGKDIWSGKSTVTITPRNITMTSASAAKDYDGAPLIRHEVDVTGDGWVKDEGADYSYTGSQTIPGSSENTFSYALKKNTKEKNYVIEQKLGTLTVNDLPDEKKYEITVKAKSDAVTYDGSSKSVDGFETLRFALQENGKTYTIEGLTASASGTDAGEYTAEVTGTAVVKDADGKDVTSQFIVHRENGKLTINQRSVTLTSGSAEKEYDGTPLTNDEVKESGEGFVNEERPAYKVTGSQTTVGFSNNTFEYDWNNNPKAKNYNITKVEGTLNVTQRDTKYEITVTPNSATVKYDGTTQSVSGFETLEFKQNGQTYQVSGLKANASGINADEYQVTVTGTAKVTDAKGNDVTDQFTVKTDNAMLTIQPRSVVMTSADAEKEYDGTPLTKNEVKESGDGFAEGDGASYTVTGSQTMKGESKNTFTYRLSDGTLESNYSIETKEGTLKVTDREEKYEITVEANSSRGNTYDAAEKSISGFKTLTFVKNNQTYTVEGLTASASETNAGTYPVKISGTAVVKDAAGNDVTNQFTVKKIDGELVIEKKKVTVTADNKSKEYGAENPELTYSVEGLAGEDKLEDITTIPQLTTEAEAVSPAGCYEIQFAEKTSKADNYVITYVNGTLEIGKNTTPIVIKAADDKKEYDGKVLTNVHAEITEGALAEGDYIDNVEMTEQSQIKNVGTQTNVIESIEIKNAAGEDVKGNYADITMESGNLEVTPAEIEITADDHGKMVGQSDPELTHTVTKDSEVEGEKAAFEGTVEREAGEEPGSYEILAGSLMLINNGAFLAGNYKLTVVPGTFTIGDVDYTVTKTLTNEGTGENGSFKAGETANFDITVENTGNVTLHDITVKEQLEGAKVLQGEGYTVNDDQTAMIAELAAGERIVVKAEYTVTQEDVDNGGVTNIVTVNAAGPDGTELDPQLSEAGIPTEEQLTDLSIVKTLISTNELYRIGDTVTYQIEVRNDGNVVLHNVVVTDQLQNAAGQITFEEKEGVTIDGNRAIIETLNPGETVILNCSYVVTREDAGAEIRNVAIGTSDETPNPEEDDTPAIQVERIYKLTINYVYANGTTAAPSVYAQYLEGGAFGYRSPEIIGYTPDYAFVRTGPKGMPARDVVVTVTYTTNPTPVTPTTPTPPTDNTPAADTVADGGTGTAVNAEPVGAQVIVDENVEVEIVPVVNENVPLANRDLDDHDCCILHFLLMVAAMLLYAAYTRSMKKRQKKIAELVDRLETEMLRRELGAEQEAEQ